MAAVLGLGLTAACAHKVPRSTASPAVRRPEVMRLVATAYCQTGRTASGVRVRSGMVAADPALLPLGSILRILEPDGIGGTYTVTDTGSAIKGQALDIFMPDCHRAVRFGRKTVVVRVMRRGTD